MDKPFLKWVGGKHRIIDKVARKLPKGDRLVEPFVGSGAVLMGTDYDAYLLADNNGDLIDLYNVLRDEGAEFIEYVRRYFKPGNNTPERYYALRERFNAIKNSSSVMDKIERCALFVYLNRHGFNGLCRYNQSGGFNVPFGRYNKPYFPEKEMQAFYRKLNERDVTLLTCSFTESMMQAQKGDVLYCDPPYAPLQFNANGFVDYVPGGF